METILLYGLITTALYYLFARAMITKPLWSRYPSWLDYYTMCAACSGFLYGLVVALAIGVPFDLQFLGVVGRTWYTPILVSLGSMIWTPILADLHVNALLRLGVADPKVVAPEEEDPYAEAP
jgi:hypothetical protein